MAKVVDSIALPKKVRQAKQRFQGRVFDLPNGTHEFSIAWGSNRNESYPCFGVQIDKFLPCSMLASDYEIAVQKSAEAVQAKAWVGTDFVHPNFEEVLLTVANNRPVSLSLKV